MSETPETDNPILRALIGLLALAGSLLGFGALYIVKVPEGNEDALMFALGIVFGWGSAVVASEYGSTTTGRRVADSAIRNIERQNLSPAGTPEDPVSVSGATDAKPVDVKETKK